LVVLTLTLLVLTLLHDAKVVEVLFADWGTWVST